MKKLGILAFAILMSLSSCKKDKNDNGMLAVFSISGTASSALYGVGITEGNKTAKAFVDLKQKKVYTIDEALTHQSDLNFVFASSYGSGGNINQQAKHLMVSSLNNGYSWHTNTGDRTLAEFGVRTECYFYYLTADDLPNFAELQSKQQLDELFAKLKPEHATQWTNCNEVQPNSNTVFNLAFKTHQGKRGVFRMTNYIPDKPFNYTIEVRMEK